MQMHNIMFLFVHAHTHKKAEYSQEVKFKHHYTFHGHGVLRVQPAFPHTHSLANKVPSSPLFSDEIKQIHFLLQVYSSG